TAVARWDEERKKTEEEKTKADTIKLATAAPLPAMTASPAPTLPSAPDKQGSLSLSSPDGMWRGTYACSAISSNVPVPEFTLNLNLQIANGISSGGGVSGRRENALTFYIDVTVNHP